MEPLSVYGIGNPLIDVLADVQDLELERLSLQRGTMQLIDEDTGRRILESLGDRDRTYASGGSCPNTMNTLAALNVAAAAAGCIGDDELGAIYLRRLVEDGVVSSLTQVDASTGTSIVLITPDGERTMSTCLGACRLFTPAAVDHELVAAAQMLYFTGYMWDTETQKQAVVDAIRTAHRNDTTVVFDVADPMAVKRYRDDFLLLIREETDVLLANLEEARMLEGNEELSAAEAARGLSRDCAVVAVKDGARGSSVGADGATSDVGAPTVDAVDTTGAGDAYAAGFIYGLLRGDLPRDAAGLATEVASRIVQQRGAQFRGSARRTEYNNQHRREYEYSS